MRRSVWTDPGLALWSLLQLALAPLLLLAKLRRYARRRRPSTVNPDRWRMPDLTPEATARFQAAERRAVVVAASFGELVLADRIARELRSALPGVAIAYAILDAKTARLLMEDRPDLSVTLWPFDALPPIARWLRLARPDLVVFTERFRFPLWCLAAARGGARVALVNGRCRTRESLAYRLAAPVYRWQFGAFSAMAMQTETHRRAAARFARPNAPVVATGDLKADQEAPRLEPDRAASLRRWLSGETPLLAAGSTDGPEEDAMVLDAFASVRSTLPCRLLLAPRQTTRTEETLRAIRARGLRHAVRSEASDGADVLVLDGFGELATAYGECAAAYVGGAYLPDGAGHNVAEPLVWGVPVAYGMNRGYFEALQLLCESRGVATRIEGAEGLAAFYRRFLTDPDERLRVAESARRMVAESRGATRRAVELLIPLLRG